jgi:hypothetical protein
MEAIKKTAPSMHGDSQSFQEQGASARMPQSDAVPKKLSYED